MWLPCVFLALVMYGGSFDVDVGTHSSAGHCSDTPTYGRLSLLVPLPLIGDSSIFLVSHENMIKGCLSACGSYFSEVLIFLLSRIAFFQTILLLVYSCGVLSVVALCLSSINTPNPNNGTRHSCPTQHVLTTMPLCLLLMILRHGWWVCYFLHL